MTKVTSNINVIDMRAKGNLHSHALLSDKKHGEKGITRQFSPCVNISHTDLDGTAYIHLGYK